MMLISRSQYVADQFSKHQQKINALLGHASALVRQYWAGADEINFVMNHASGAGPIISRSSKYKLDYFRRYQQK